MINSELLQLTVLKCGCAINEITGELYRECMPHKQRNFTQ